MAARTTNLLILALLLAELASGLASFLVGSPDGRWVFWLHGAGGLSLVVLVTWKWRIVMRSFARRGRGLWSLTPVLLSACFVGTLLSGVWWAAIGRGDVWVPGYGSMRPLVLHAVLALLLVPPFAIHAALRWPRPRVADFRSRRTALRLLAVGAGGLALWQGLWAVSRVTGPERRFTGSREEASLQGNAHPVTNWLTDRRQQVDPASWRLRVSGLVDRPLALSYVELSAMAGESRHATLDCTGGWYTEQEWSGVPLVALLSRAGVAVDARSLVFQSVTGYRRRFPIDSAPALLLATHVGGVPLSTGHGWPARLVAPHRRGYQWVKWVELVELSAHPAWWQSPLPLQ